MTPSDLLEAALGLADQPDENFLPLGRILSQLRAEDPSRFHGFIKLSEVSRRKAYYLVAVARAFEGLDVPDARLAAIGWTKLQIIAPHVDAANLEGLLKLAETETVRELRRALSGLESQGKTRCVLLYFTLDEYAVIEKALVAHGAGKVGKALVDKEAALLKLVQTGKAGDG
jgi:hypothetical protein